MTTLLERLAETIWNEQHPLVPDMSWDEIATPGKWVGVQDALDAAHAVLAILPPMLVPVDESADGDIGPVVTETGHDYAAKSVSVSWPGSPTADVSDDQIAEAATMLPHESTAAGQIGRVRALLDAQAAAYVARLSGKQQHLERIVAERDGAVAEVEALRAEVERHIEAVAAAARLVNDVEEEADDDRDRAVAEALEHAAQKIAADERMFLTDRRYAIESIREQIPEVRA